MAVKSFIVQAPEWNGPIRNENFYCLSFNTVEFTPVRYNSNFPILMYFGWILFNTRKCLVNFHWRFAQRMTQGIFEHKIAQNRALNHFVHYHSGLMNEIYIYKKIHWTLKQYYTVINNTQSSSKIWIFVVFHFIYDRNSFIRKDCFQNKSKFITED